MKKIMAIMLSLLMVSSAVSISASAVDTNETKTGDDYQYMYDSEPSEDEYEPGSLTKYTEYSYRTKTTTTSYETSLAGYAQESSKWVSNGSGTVEYVSNFPSGFLTSNSLYTKYHKTPKTASETATTKVTINPSVVKGYIYYHWCRGTYTAGPINRYISETGAKKDSFTTFHAFETSTALSFNSSAKAFQSSQGRVCKDTYWWFGNTPNSNSQLPIYKQTYNNYKKQFTYYKWSDYSDWSTQAVTASATTEVKTRTVYKYLPVSESDDNVEVFGECGDNLNWTLTEDGTLTISGTGKMDEYVSNDSNDDEDDSYDEDDEDVDNSGDNDEDVTDGSVSLPPYYDYCEDVVSVVVKDGVTSISDYAFKDCVNLESATIADSVEEIGCDAFDNTTLLDDEDSWDSSVLYVGNHLIKADEEITGNVTVKSGTKTIAGSAFRYCTELKGITIPDSVKSIGKLAFFDCESLTDVTLGNGLKTIDESAFEYCISLDKISIPSSVTSIKSNAFADTKYYTTASNWSKKVLYIGNYLIASDEEIEGSCVVKSGTRLIADYAFDYSAITDIDIPLSVAYIGESAFENCTELENVSIRGNVSILANSTFKGCTSLTNLLLPATITSIGDEAFEDCDGISYIYFAGSQSKWNSIVISDENNDNLENAEYKYNCNINASLEDLHEHTPELRNKKAATYFAKGYTGDTVCTSCGKVLSKGSYTSKKTLGIPTVKLTGGKKKVIVKYDKISNANRYVISYRPSTTNKWKTVTVTKTKYTIAKLGVNKKYYVKVRACLLAGSKKAYSKYSTIKNVKTKK